MLLGFTDFLMENVLSLYDNLEFCIRILLSGALGAIIGLERASRNKEAGIRTHIIIGMTSAMFMILSKYAFFDLSEIASAGIKGADPSRIASQVVTGISFLCAGVIFRQGKYNIRGLTTAAGMWATSSVGMAIGAGLYWVGLMEALVLVLMQIVLHKHPVGNDAPSIQEVRIRLVEDKELDKMLEKLKQLHKGEIVQSEISRESSGIRVKVTIRAAESIRYDETIRLLQEDSNIKEIESYGAEVFVVGSAFFGADDKKVAIDNLHSALNA